MTRASQLSLPSFEIVQGDSSQVNLTLDTDDDSMSGFSGFQFDIFLPQGLSLSDESIDGNLEAAGFVLDVTEYSETVIRIIGYTTGSGTLSRELMTLTFEADESMAAGISEINLANVVFAAPDGLDIPLADSTASVTVKEKDSGVDVNVSDSVSVKADIAMSCIRVFNAQGESISIYDPEGKRVVCAVVESPQECFALGRGLYIVRVAGRTFKFLL